MKKIEIQEAFEIEVNLIDSNIDKPTTSDLEYWMTAGIDKFTKTRTSGTNAKQEGFEQSQKRIDDLRTLVTTFTYSLTPQTEKYTVTLPTNYMQALGETVQIYSNDDCWPKRDGQPLSKRQDVTEATIENFDEKYNNSLSMHRLHNNSARPLRLFEGNTVNLYTDGNYYIKTYILTYLRLPNKFTLGSNPFEEYTEFPASTHQELVKTAVQLYLENKANPRYESYLNETNTME